MRDTIEVTARKDGTACSILDAVDSWNMKWEGDKRGSVSEMNFRNIDTMAEALRDLAIRSQYAIKIVTTDFTMQTKTLPRLVEYLTTLIHDIIDDDVPADDPEAREVAFDAHPWAPLREALWAAEPRIRGEDCLRLEALSGDAIGSIDAVTAWRISGAGAPAVLEDEQAVAQEVARRMASGNLSIRLICLEHVIEVADIDELCEELTCVIADGIPSIDEEDARDDDFDNHPLTPIRDALVDVSPNFGGGAPDF